MYVLTTTVGFVNSIPYTPGQVLEIPGVYYNEQSMTRLNTVLTGAQLAALIPWSTTCPGWPFPINGA